MEPNTKPPIDWRSFMLCVIIAMGQFVGAYGSVIIGTTIGKVDFNTRMGLQDHEGHSTHNATALKGAITGLYQAGAFFGCLIAAWMMERWGRKTCLMIGAVLSIPGLAGLTGSMNVAEFLAFRFISGIGTWMSGTAASAYIPELAPAAHRGLFAGMNGVAIGLGVTVASYVGMGFYFCDNEAAQWRAPMGFPLICPLLLLCAYPFLPESPRYLLLKDKPNEARKAFDNFNKTSRTDPMLLEEEYSQMQIQADHDRKMESSWTSLLTHTSYRKRIILACILTFLNQSTGVLVLNNYGTTFYQALGFSKTDRQLFQGNRDIIALLGNFLGSWIIDRTGRKSLILFSYIGCFLTVLIEMIIVAVFADSDSSSAKTAGVALFYVFLLFYSFGIDVGTYVYLGEMFPNHIRVKGVGLALATLNVTATIYLSVAATAFADIGWKFFLVFVVTTFCGIIWIITFIPETRGVPLEEMEVIFGNAKDTVIIAPHSTLAHGNANAENLTTPEKGMTAHVEP